MVLSAGNISQLVESGHILLFKTKKQDEFDIKLVKELSEKGKDYIAQKLAGIIKMSITEIVMHNRNAKDRGDLSSVSMMLGFLVKHKQATNITLSNTPKSGAKRKIELYDSSLENRNLCAVYDSDENYLYVEITPNGDICKLVEKYIKSNKYTLSK